MSTSVRQILNIFDDYFNSKSSVKKIICEDNFFLRIFQITALYGKSLKLNNQLY
jgi:hypothetical protein